MQKMCEGCGLEHPKFGLLVGTQDGCDTAQSSAKRTRCRCCADGLAAKVTREINVLKLGVALEPSLIGYRCHGLSFPRDDSECGHGKVCRQYDMPTSGRYARDNRLLCSWCLEEAKRDEPTLEHVTIIPSRWGQQWSAGRTSTAAAAANGNATSVSVVSTRGRKRRKAATGASSKRGR